MDYEVQHSARRCSATGREFAPGETYYSVLVAEGAELKRCDYAADAWHGPPDEAIGWWKSRVPERNAGKKHWAPNDVMLDFWDQLAEELEKQDMRYVLTLLLVRRRVFRLEEEKSRRAGTAVARGVLPPPRSHVRSARRDARANANRSDPGGACGAAAVDGKWRMTNDEIEMTKEVPMTKHERAHVLSDWASQFLVIWISHVLSSFDFRHSSPHSFVIWLFIPHSSPFHRSRPPLTVAGCC